MRIFGLSVVRNEADIIRLTVLHHLAVGLDRLLIIDNGSTDGTDCVLCQLSRDSRVEWSRDEGVFRQGEMLTTLARRAAAQGADWVIPFDADEFWYAPQSNIRRVLESPTAAALRVRIVDRFHYWIFANVLARKLIQLDIVRTVPGDQILDVWRAPDAWPDCFATWVSVDMRHGC